MKKILWIEDDLAPLRMIIDEISDKYNIKFDFSSTMALALRKLSSNDYDGLILDLTIPLGMLPPQLKKLEEMFDSHHQSAGFGLLNLYRALHQHKREILRELPPILICSNHQQDEVAHFMNEFPTDLQFISKRDIYFDKDRFLAKFGHFAGVTDADEIVSEETTEAPPADQDDVSDRDFKRFAHDQRAKLHNIASLVHGSVRGVGVLDPGVSLPNASIFLRKRMNHLLDDLKDAIKDTLDNIDFPASSRRKAQHACDTLEDSLSTLIEGLLPYTAAKKAVVETLLIQIGSAVDVLKPPQHHNIRDLLHSIRTHMIVETMDSLVKILQQVDAAFDSYSRTKSSQGSKANTFDAVKCIRELLYQFEIVSQSNGIEIRLEISTENFEVAGDQESFEKCVSNIIDNAIKYTHKPANIRPWITVRIGSSVESAGRCLIVEIENWGTPLSEPFERLREEGRRGISADRTGRGRGLAIAADSIEGLGGNLALGSRPARSRGRDIVVAQLRVPEAARS